MTDQLLVMQQYLKIVLWLPLQDIIQNFTVPFQPIIDEIFCKMSNRSDIENVLVTCDIQTDKNG